MFQSLEHTTAVALEAGVAALLALALQRELVPVAAEWALRAERVRSLGQGSRSVVEVHELLRVVLERRARVAALDWERRRAREESVHRRRGEERGLRRRVGRV